MSKMDEIKVTLPPMVEGQTGWKMYGVTSQWKTPPDERKWHIKIVYRSLLWLGNWADAILLWIWERTRNYAPPLPVEIKPKYYPIELSNNKKT